MLAIEIDGVSHLQKGQTPMLERHRRLESLGVHRHHASKIRMVKREMPKVLAGIEGWIQAQPKKGQS